MANSVISDESPKFYEADGALRAFSNRAIIISVIACIVALVGWLVGCRPYAAPNRDQSIAHRRSAKMVSPNKVPSKARLLLAHLQTL